MDSSKPNKTLAQTCPGIAPGSAPNEPHPCSTDMMCPHEAAAYLRVEVNTLAMWRSTKRYPLPYVKVGRRVQYRKAHLDAFLALRTVDLAA